MRDPRNPYNVTLGPQLRSWREAAGLSQKELAELLKCAPTTLNGWEKLYRRMPSNITERLIPITMWLYGRLDPENGAGELEDAALLTTAD